MKSSLQKEIDVLKKCKNSAVLSYYGSIPKENEVWILMDYCAAGSVKDIMKSTLDTLGEEQIAQVCKETLKGLAYLHANNIIHLDVKSANILLTGDGQVKIGMYLYLPPYHIIFIYIYFFYSGLWSF
jgi:serine/threonine protein kinase